MEPIAEAFVKLGLAVWQHAPDFVDAYFGPPEWKREAQEMGRRPLDALLNEASDLLESINGNQVIETARLDYLEGEARAIHTALRIMVGEKLPHQEQVNGLYSISPKWLEEDIFNEIHIKLNEMLPGEGALIERLEHRRDRMVVNLEENTALVEEIAEELRRRTKASLLLPADESVEIRMVKGAHWGGHNQYLGERRSLIEINLDRPWTAMRLVTLIAHEGYPGHHTERANKELLLVDIKGWLEQTLVLSQAPSGIVSEGIATHAPLFDETLTQWCQNDFFPRLGLGDLDAKHELEIDTALFKLAGVSNNAALMLHRRDASEEEAQAYLQDWGLRDEQSARATIHFIRQTGSYIYTYYMGFELLEALFAITTDRLAWFRRLLCEPVTPRQISRWIDYEFP
jgi:hypothetical protein